MKLTPQSRTLKYNTHIYTVARTHKDKQLIGFTGPHSLTHSVPVLIINYQQIWQIEGFGWFGIKYLPIVASESNTTKMIGQIN